MNETFHSSYRNKLTKYIFSKCFNIMEYYVTNNINWSKNKLHNILNSKIIKYEIVIYIIIYVVYFLLMNYVHLLFIMNGIHSLLHFCV
jgi:hypothetical protein